MKKRNLVQFKSKFKVELVEKAFKLERAFLIEAAGSVKPGDDVLVKFYEQFSKSIQEIQVFLFVPIFHLLLLFLVQSAYFFFEFSLFQAYREKNRTSQFFNHLSTISESVGALGWIAVSPAPAPYIKEMSDSGQFFSNRVLKDYKEK